ncbi:MAG: hypothetical protein MI924_32930 [Chloroflexales bacterium]|nr:hypothetical protein [Chloroflexales bacterium]
MQRLAEAFQCYLNDSSGADTQLALGSWSNANGITCAYLTCYPQDAMDEEQTIEFAVNVQIEPRMVILTIDLCRPHGVILAGLGEWRITYDQQEELLEQLGMICKQAEADSIEQMKRSIAH